MSDSQQGRAATVISDTTSFPMQPVQAKVVPPQSEAALSDKMEIVEDDVVKKRKADDDAKLQPPAKKARSESPTPLAAANKLILWAEHNKMRTLLKETIATANMEEKQRLFNTLIKELSQHEVAEEVVVHPSFRNIAADSSAVDQALQEETSAMKELVELDKQYGKKIDASINAKLKALEPSLEAHMATEESRIFPVLEKALGPDDLASMNTWFDRVKSTAPTRPHPDGPRSLIGNLVVGPLASFIDHLRDLGKKF